MFPVLTSILGFFCNIHVFFHILFFLKFVLQFYLGFFVLYQLLKQKVRDCDIDPFGVRPAQNFVSGKEIKGTIVHGLLNAEMLGGTKYLVFVANRFCKRKPVIFRSRVEE